MKSASKSTVSDAPAPDLTVQGLIHDLNNVFQTLLEAADVLSEDGRWEGLSATMFRSIERGKEITQSLHVASPQPAALETVLEKAVTFVQDSVALRRGPRIEFSREVEPGIVLQQPWGWERVLLNLFLNSVQAMPRGGTIFVRGRRLQREFEIVVADEGVGIAPELLPSVFEPGVSTKASSGLGLHIVSSIVHGQNGSVCAANRDGGGAQFIITIPAGTVTRSASA
jgi:signal transduction histidine kinase